ncbi:DmX-like protein 2 [Elysia marginata]|uniref:DmX-like protein 2 n=1 Tax=Elysia marginata TaxID=1093978 RepID=A0AAV4I9W6_9GAST|nr:DmX-like protein 2 [Elysia marginata]
MRVTHRYDHHIVIQAYASGCDIVILASNFQRVVNIPGVLRGSIKVSCVDCSTDTGKIAASFARKIHIFEPTPSSTQSSHKLDYRWFPTAELNADCFIRCLSWNVEGSRLLTGGEIIQMWEFSNQPAPTAAPQSPTHKVQFHLGAAGGEEDDPVTQRLVHAIADPDHITDQQQTDLGAWECVWKIKPASPVTHLKYSPDSFVFASLGKDERLVKIWYEDQKVSQGLMRHDSVLSPKKSSVHYSFIYISHPRAVKGFEWRQTSKYMPRGSVANMLGTSCEDNVCRIFVETILPDAGLVDLEQFDPAMSLDPKYHTQRHKKRFVHRLKTIRQAIHKRRKFPKSGGENLTNGQPMKTSSSVHDFHKFAIHHNGVSPVLHFHLACSINPETDIPLLPISAHKDDKLTNFRLHWMNNKDMEFTMEAERLLQDLHQRLLAEEASVGVHTSNRSHSDDEEEDEDEDYDSEEGSQTRRKNMSPHEKIRMRQNGERASLSSGEDQDKEDEAEHPPEFPIHLLQTGILDRLDRKIDALLLDWHSSPDYVFSIHPVDGSFLVWLIDHLDESTPFTFHQAQASFSSRLPKAFPIPDARSMASNIIMYCNYDRSDARLAMQLNETLRSGDVPSSGGDGRSNLYNPANNKVKELLLPDVLVPSIHMVTKHTNGTLNQWQVRFAERTKFQNIVSVSHVDRACGHRFRTNSAACHPVLPLMLTTSHHNLPPSDSATPSTSTDPFSLNVEEDRTSGSETPDVEQVGPNFCSELILWQVMPVGPLSASGGIVELCRINNCNQSAFTNVAWVPTLLPSTSLGAFSNSPSALFVASDGQCLRLYQAVIDARSLLLEKTHKASSNVSTSSTSSYHEISTPVQRHPAELFNIISLQSSARPGCVLELDAISDGCQDWRNVQLLHVYQEQLITGKESGGESEAVVDLSGQSTFDENFYLVVVEKNPDKGCILHMWKITIDSKPSKESYVNGDSSNWEHCESMVDSYDDELSPQGLNLKPECPKHFAPGQIMVMSVRTIKVLTQTLSLPEGVEVISAAPAGGHLSSASIYPACFAPYQFVTACSDGEIRFWSCNISCVKEHLQETSVCSVTSYEFTMDEGGDASSHHQMHVKKENQLQNMQYSWAEWVRPSSVDDKASSVSLKGQPIAVSCAYSGRIAVAYRSGPVRSQPEHPDEKFVNLRVLILECESTGGSEWVQEDTIELNNIKIPDPKHEIDLCMLQGYESLQAQPSEASEETFASAETAAAFMTRTKSVPSLSTVQSVKKSISEAGNRKGLLCQKCLVQLDWVATEDGSHLLTVGVGSKVLIYGQVSNEIANSLKALRGENSERTQEDKRSAFASSKLMTMNKSMVTEEFQEEIKWMRLKGIELSTADGLPPLPMHINWVRAGVLVVGMDNEMQVFSQWRSNSDDAEIIEDEATIDKRNLTEANLVTAASSLNLCNNFKSKTNFKSSMSLSNLRSGGMQTTSKKETLKRSNQTSASSKASVARSDSLSSLPMLYDSGLFDAARFANPVLPQYHPKLLTELLNCGKIRRVKAILAHLVRCISTSDGVQTISPEDYADSLGKASRPRSVSMHNDSDPLMREASSIHYVEIKSIPPLPLYALIAADKETTSLPSEMKNTAHQANKEPDYSDLLDTNVHKVDDDLDEQLFSTSADSTGSLSRRGRLPSGSNRTAPVDPYHFNPSQADVLREYLFKLNLPGLSGNDQFHLAALAEVMGSTTLGLGENAGENHQTEQQGSVDECGLRFLLALRQHQCLVKTLPPFKRQALIEAGIRTSYIVWGFHSESSEVLLQAIPCVKADEPVWDELKVYGVGWWLNNMMQLKTLILKVANTAFKKSKKPMDAALYYLAMKKKTIVKSLFKTVHDSKMESFFAQDFEKEDNQRIAMKNAYHLLSKGQYQHAVALFFLAGRIDMAVNVILDKLEDLQLAIVLCRLYDGESMLPDSVKRLFYENILGLDASGENYEAKKAHPDPFLRSMALWQLKDYQSSLQTLLERNVGKAHTPDEKADRMLQLPRVFNFYNYLRIHPLITRLRLASSSQQRREKLITGFTHSNTLVSEGISTLDQVTPSERRLFFAAAHAHFQNGCPVVAIEVMRKLPKSALLVEEDLQQMEYFAKRRRKSMQEINKTTGTLDDAFSLQGSIDATSTPTAVKNSNKAADLFNSGFGSSDSFNNKAGSIDWGKPLTAATSIDWGAPSRVSFADDLDLELDLGLGDSDEEDDGGENEDGIEIKSDSSASATQGARENNAAEKDEEDKERAEAKHIDIMAQQYKFIACLKVIMEELGNLATGFEVDGGQLRHQLYIWLEKEVEVLSVLCDYGNMPDSAMQPANEGAVLEDGDDEESQSRQQSASTRSVTKASLHEVIKAEKQDLQSKVARMARRKAWLRANQHLLRTLASYCILQGSGGGGLASVSMELLLLLQELQQERPQQQLLSPLPFPTTLPLLSATITNSRSVIADPIQYLQGSIQDLLQSVVEMPLPPSAQTDIGLVSTIRDLSVALSSCIYQSLCDSDSFNVEVTDVGIDGFINPEFSYPSSHLMAGVRRSRHHSAGGGDGTVNTPPAKWPGVASLKVLLAREKDDDSPRINIMLTEALISVYMSLLISGLSMYDSQMLYRLVANKLDTQTWNALFGGGNKMAIKTEKNPMRMTNQDDVSKHRMMFNMRVMSSGGPGQIKHSSETFKETFVPPEISMVNYLMTKPFVPSAETLLDYDSDDSFASEDDNSSDEDEYDDDDDDIITEKKITRPTSLSKSKANVEHSDPGSYSWCIIRYAVVKSVISNFSTFLPQIGIELTELPNASPLLHAVMKVLDQWLEVLQSRLDLFGGAPSNYIPGLMIDVATGQPLSKLQALFLTENTPFLCARSTLPIKRLWFHLLKQEPLRDIFMRYVYKKRQEPDESMMGSVRTTSSGFEQPVKDPMKIVHKEQDIITAFAINQANSNLMVLSTQKEVVELDVGYLLKPPVWLEDDNEYDIEMLRTPNPGPEAPEFLVVQTPMDTVQPSSVSSLSPSSQYNNHIGGSQYMPSPSPSLMSVQTGRGSSVILRRSVLGVRRIGSHPVLPHYMTGGADGAVRLWEWGHGHPLTTLRQAGSFPKVTKVLFNAQGNKCCVSDVEGSICLWQVGLGSAFNKPIMSFQCHNKTTSDFQFVGSSSMLATAGQSSENRNVCLWDTLLPLRSSLVHGIFDLRQRKLKHTFQAHEGPIKSLTLDPDEDYFVTGSAEGDIKVWGLKIHQLIFSFPGEHSKTTFFKNVGSTSGVAQLHVGPLNHLYSCGVDGSMKLRQLPERELVVHHWA